MNPTADAVTKATANLDDDLKPIEVVGDEPKPKVEDKKPGGTPPEEDDPKKGKDPKDGDEGFSADEVTSPKDPKEPEDKKSKTPEVTDIDTNSLAPEAKYIVDNLPYITARIKDGDGVKDVQVKSWTQLPEDVQFASKRDELAFMNALTAQENRALSLQAKFNQDQQVQQNTDFEKKEDEANWRDIADLQKEGLIAKFKGDKSDPEFANDESAKEMEDILAFMQERNKQYLAEYNQGRRFKHIGFREAFYEYRHTHPDKAPAQKKEDTERKKIAEEMNINRGLASRELKKPTVRSGTRINQILDRIDAEEW